MEIQEKAQQQQQIPFEDDRKKDQSNCGGGTELGE
jgi:hypothetical protein